LQAASNFADEIASLSEDLAPRRLSFSNKACDFATSASATGGDFTLAKLQTRLL